MAEIKYLSAGSSQIFALLLRDKNKAPINANKIHMEGIIYTGNNKDKGYRFSINNGVVLGCTIQLDMIIFNINPLLPVGKVAVYTKTYIDNSNTPFGNTAIIENTQTLNIEIVKTGTFMSDRQGTMFDDLHLPIIVEDKMIAWEGNADILPEIKKYIKTTEFTDYIKTLVPGQDISNLAKVDLSNISNEIFKNKAINSGITTTATISDDDFLKQAKKVGLAENNLEDVDLAKLYDKGTDAKLAASDLSNVRSSDITNKIGEGIYAKSTLSNVSTGDFDKILKSNSAFIALEKNQHPAVQGLTADEIKALFYTNRYEEVNAVDLTQAPFKDATTLLMVYQITSEGQNIVQVLPPYTSNQIIMVEVLYSKGITTGSVEIDVVQGEHMEGVTTQSSIVFKENGYAGYFIPLKNEQGWEFISHAKTQISTIGASDEKGNIVTEVKNLKFKEPLFIEHDDTKNETGVTLGDIPFVFKDKLQNKIFKSKMLQSLDGSIRISAIPAGQDGEGNEIIDADMSVTSKSSEEGIFATLGEDELINSKNTNSRLYFGDLKVKGGQAIHQDLNSKSFIIQDIDPQDDPNVSGGTTFLVAVYFEASPFELSTGITQDGNIQVGLMNDDNQFMTDIYGNPMFVQIDYKQGDSERKELYIGQIQAKAFTRVHFGIKCNFANEEVISIGSRSCIMLQAITKDSSYGDALAAFMLFTGYRINLDNKYYGYNSLNLARDLIYPVPEYEANNEDFYLGDNVHINIKSKAKVKIDNYKLTIKDNGVDLPIFSIYKRYNQIDTHLCKGKTYKVTVKITDKTNAFKVSILKYIGSDNNIPSPELLRYNNDTPVFNNGWVTEGDIFITEDYVDGEHTKTGDLTIPVDGKEFAIVLYPVVSQIPTSVTLSDFEGDIFPTFNHVFIVSNENDNSKIIENQKGYIKTTCYTPKESAALRYTCNSRDTRVPIGIVKGDSKVINDNSWNDIGAYDPDKLQGNYKFLTNGIVESAQYGVLVRNEQSSINNVELWWSKVNSDGSFTEIPNSKIATTIEANRTNPKVVMSNPFSFEVSKNDSIAVFMKSDKDDGFYIESKTDGKPFYWSSIVFNEESIVPKNLVNLISQGQIQFTKSGTPVDDATKYSISIDVDTGKITVVTK